MKASAEGGIHVGTVVNGPVSSLPKPNYRQKKYLTMEREKFEKPIKVCENIDLAEM